MRKRLNSNVSAVHYDLHHVVDLSRKKDFFEFDEKITLNAKKPTKEYTANARDIKIKKAILIANGKKEEINFDKIRYDNKKETITFIFPEKIPKGSFSIELSATGKHGDVNGLYQSRYIGREGKEAYMATTQFEAADAREAFVCEDEPAAKATYDVSITIDKNLKAISNMPEKETVDLGNGMKKVIFERTPIMSSYLVYLGVGDFEIKETMAGKTKVRVITLPGKINQANYSLEAAKKLLLKKEEYYGIPFPLPKLDLIAVPDFASGAMENWGAITFREDRLLGNPQKSSVTQKIATISTISHELEHMWFGNLVTMEWWDDLWLNESFADVRAYNGLDEDYPELEPWADFLAARVSSAYQTDGLKNSHPVHVDVKSPSEIREIFDAISYSKGGMILRMIERLLGKEVYRKGLIIYLKRHAYLNTKADDLWKALEEASGKPVGKIVKTWINKIGLPIVDAELDGNKLKVSQRRFKYLGSERKTTWNIPLLIDTGKNKIDNEILEEKSQIIKLDGKIKWLKINSGEFGFYRVKYSRDLMNGIKYAVKEKKISGIDRWGIHNDIAALCFAGELSLNDYLEFVTEAYRDEDDYLTLIDIFATLRKIKIISADEKFLDEMQKRIFIFYEHLLSNVGFTPIKDEKEARRAIRAMLMAGLGRMNDAKILKYARELAEKEFSNPGSIDPSMRGTAYKLAAWQGDEKTFKKLIEIYKKAMNPKERNNLAEAKEVLEAIGNFKDANILEKSFEFILSKEVKSSDLLFFAVSMLSNPYGRKRLWPFMKKNWKTIKSYYDGGLTNHFNRILLGLSTLANMKTGDEIRKFIGGHMIYGTERSLKQLMEMMEINEKFLQRARKSV